MDPRYPAGMGIEVREVRPEEYAEAGAVTMSAYMEYVPGRDESRPGFNHDDWTEYLSLLADVGSRVDHARVLVAIDGDIVVGCTTVELDERISADSEPLRPGQAHLRMVAVDPHHRRRGIARLLLTKGIAMAREAGKTEMTLNTSDRMVAAQRLYESLGFVRGPDRTFDDRPSWRSYALDLSAIRSGGR